MGGDRVLGPGEKPEVRWKYVHLWQKDYRTWTAFLESEWNLLEEVWYDVHVGKAMDVPAASPAYLQAVADGVSRKRIDVVGRMGRTLYIIEIKPEANMKGIGQVVTYRNLFIDEFEVSGPVIAMIVATTCDRDIEDTAIEEHVRIIALEGVRL